MGDNYIFELPLKVRDYELDSEGIVNNANYLHYLELTRHEFCESVGLPFGKMVDMDIMPVLRRVEIDYISPLRSGDEMISRLSIHRDGPRFIFRQNIIKPDKTTVVDALVTVVSLENGKISRGDSLASFFKDYL